MAEKYIEQAVALANKLGHNKVYTVDDFYDYLPLSDGCSGYLSKVYSYFGKTISCERSCNAHDWLYSLGGNWKARLRADLLLQRSCARAGIFPEGIKGIPLRIWRWFRSWIIFIVVRKAGWPFWG